MAALRVLVVDDHVDQAESLAHLLRLGGCTVTTVSSGPCAVVASRRDRPHVAVLELRMPKMDGDEVARRLKGEVDGVFLIAYSENSPNPTAASPFDLHLLKGDSFDGLLGILARLDRCLHGTGDATVKDETLSSPPGDARCLPSTVGEMTASGVAGRRS